MLQFVGQSIDLYEKLDKESGGAFGMNRPGYTFFSAQPESLERYKTEAQLCESYGAGAARFHDTEDLENYNYTSSLTPISQVQNGSKKIGMFSSIWNTLQDPDEHSCRVGCSGA